MKNYISFWVLLFCLLCPLSSYADPLPSWNSGPAKSAIIDFVKAVSLPEGKDYLPPEQRIAVFDNDGTLWSEQPVYFQLIFAMDRIKELAPAHPEWKDRSPYKEVLSGDLKGLSSLNKDALVQLIMTSHTGMTTDEFTARVNLWLQTARHPTLNKPYTELVYKPMLELLDYLRANDFKTFIVSGGGIEFMRPWVEDVYGIPPEQVIGSSVVTRFELRDGKPVLIREPELFFIDDKSGKPVGINHHIGRRPIFAFGNSDGDLQMLQWTTLSVNEKRFAGIVHHTDSDREFAYDRDSHIGRLDKGLTEAMNNEWTVVDMKKDWKVVYP